MTDEKTVYVSWYTCDCEWVTEVLRPHAQRGSTNPAQQDQGMDRGELMTVSDAEYEAMVEELIAKKECRNRIVAEIEDLQEEISEIENSRRNLPTEPGMYWHPEGRWPAFLDDNGRWSDGWGNDLEETDNRLDVERVKRVEFVDE